MRNFIKKKKKHLWAGRILTLLYPGHVFATRIVPYLHHTTIDYTFPILSLKMYPSVFPIYYIILGSSGLYHMMIGFLQARYVLGIKAKMSRYHLCAILQNLNHFSKIKDDHS